MPLPVIDGMVRSSTDRVILNNNDARFLSLGTCKSFDWGPLRPASSGPFFIFSILIQGLLPNLSELDEDGDLYILTYI